MASHFTTDSVNGQDPLRITDVGCRVVTALGYRGFIVSTRYVVRVPYYTVDFPGAGLIEFDKLGMSTYKQDWIRTIDRPLVVTNGFPSIWGLPHIPDPQVLESPENPVPIARKVPKCWPGSHVWISTGSTLSFCKICDASARQNMMDGTYQILED